jgi:hypothetical protein
MKKAVFVLGVFLVLFAFTFQASASIGQFVGKWQNVNPNTKGITALEIAVTGTNVTVHAWGQCTPTDCDWGVMPAYAYAPNVSAPIAASAVAISVVHKESFAERLIIIRPAGSELRVESYTHFTDSSNRSNYFDFEMFKRGAPGPGTPGPLTEDCLPFDPNNTKVQKIGADWTIVDSGHRLFAFGNNGAAANKALAIIKRYHMNKSCFVGRPDPSFSYLLVNNQSPVGPFPGEDCLKFNPANVQVQQIQGAWKIVDGNHWMYDFGDKKDEADKALAIIKKYGFGESCFVTRPNPPFKYLRR